MSRRKDTDRKRKLIEALRSGKPAKKEKTTKRKKQKESDADLNDDGKVDEEDLGLVRKAVEAAKKKAKKIVKRKDK